MKPALPTILSLAACCAVAAPYEGNWESLNQHRPPEWLLDAKLGIYAHWGLYSVPAFAGEWYAFYLYHDQRDDVIQYHTENFGDPSVFGYKDFVQHFTAEHYDPEAWARAIKYSGAKYAGLAVVHHDGFMLWHSKVNRWNVGEMGPKRDLYGDLVKALRAEGLRTVATFHLLRSFDWMTPSSNDWAEAEAKGWDVVDPANSDFYWSSQHRTYTEFVNEWERKVHEVVDTYQPDILWFDGGDFRKNGIEEQVMGTLAYYLNQEEKWGKQIEVLNKMPMTRKRNFHDDFGILNFEEGRDREAGLDRPWIDDMKISDQGWGYLHGQQYKTANEIVDGLIDRVARGGGLMLNLSPKPDGTIPSEQLAVLKEMGDFLTPNGEAIFSTRPWKTHGEGDETKLHYIYKNRPFWKFDQCDGTDIRYTRSKDFTKLYAMVLGYPPDGVLHLKSFDRQEADACGGIKAVTHVETGKPVEWEMTETGLRIRIPEYSGNNALAYAFSIDVKTLLDP